MTRTIDPVTSIAVIGAGLIGKRHIDHVVSEPLTRLAAIVEPTPAGKELAVKHGVPCYSSVTELIAARDASEVQVDAAIVGTPTHTCVIIPQVPAVELTTLQTCSNRRTTDRCWPTCSCEEGGSPSGRRCGEVWRESEGTRGSTSTIVHRFPHASHNLSDCNDHGSNPYTVALKSALDSGKLGKLLGIQGVWATRKGGNNYYSDWKLLPVGGGTINSTPLQPRSTIRDASLSYFS
jgi:hypothetical protein